MVVLTHRAVSATEVLVQALASSALLNSDDTCAHRRRDRRAVDQAARAALASDASIVNATVGGWDGIFAGVGEGTTSSEASARAVARGAPAGAPAPPAPR